MKNETLKKKILESDISKLVKAILIIRIGNFTDEQVNWLLANL